MRYLMLFRPSDTAAMESGAPPTPEEGPPGLPLDFIRRNPPEHDRLRELATRPFGPPTPPDASRGCAPGWPRSPTA